MEATLEKVAIDHSPIDYRMMAKWRDARIAGKKVTKVYLGVTEAQEFCGLQKMPEAKAWSMIRNGEMLWMGIPVMLVAADDYLEVQAE